MDNKVAKKTQVSIQTYLRSGAVQERLQETLKDRAQQFTISLISAVNSNVLLQECVPQSIVMAAMKAAAMDLPIDPNLGQAFIIPYRNNKLGVYEAQFQIGAKGFKQLAIRSGRYKLINETDVRQGEYQGENRLSGEMVFEWVDDDKEREKLPVEGYVAYLKLTTGYEKSLYMTVNQLKAHAKKYSQTYRKGYGQWVDDFDSMSRKTVTKLLISRHGAMSTQMQQAILADQAAVEEDSFKYIDNDKTPEASEAPKKPRKATKTHKDIPEAETVPEAPEEAEEANHETPQDEVAPEDTIANDARKLPKTSREEARVLLDDYKSRGGIVSKDVEPEPKNEDELEAIRLSIMLAGDLMNLTETDLKKIYKEVSGKEDINAIVDPMELETIYAYLEEMDNTKDPKDTEETPKQQSAFNNVKSMFPDAKDITPKK
jgi:recombination protein RecT